MRESSIALSRREHLTNDTESYRVRMRITTVEVACAKKENVLFKKNTPPPPTYVCISIIFNFSWNHCHTFEKQKTKVMQSFFWRGGRGKQGVLWEMRKWRIGESRRGENGYERRCTTGRGTRDAKAGEDGVWHSTLSFFIIESLLARSRRLTFTSNGKRECVPRDQVSSLLVVYCSLFLHLNQ